MVHRKLRPEDWPADVEVHTLATVRGPFELKGDLKDSTTGAVKHFKAVTMVRHQTQVEERLLLRHQYPSLQVTMVKELARDQRTAPEGQVTRTVPLRGQKGVEVRTCGIWALEGTALILPKAERKVVEVQAKTKDSEVVLKVRISRKTSPSSYDEILKAPAAAIRHWGKTLLGAGGSADVGEVFAPGGRPTEFAGEGGGAAYIKGYWRMTKEAAIRHIAVSGLGVHISGNKRLRVFFQPFAWQDLGLEPTGITWNLRDFLGHRQLFAGPDVSHCHLAKVAKCKAEVTSIFGSRFNPLFEVLGVRSAKLGELVIETDAPEVGAASLATQRGVEANALVELPVTDTGRPGLERRIGLERIHVTV